MAACAPDDLGRADARVALDECVFPDVSESDWETAAEAALRGEPLSSLVTTLLDGIETAPLYTAHRNGTEADPAGLPGDAPFTRGATAASGGRGWEVRQVHDVRLPGTPDAVAVDTASGVDAVTVARGWSAVDDAVLLDAAVGDATHDAWGPWQTTSAAHEAINHSAVATYESSSSIRQLDECAYER